MADGYQAVTMRSVAAQAGVDPALISYFFGSKRGLFGAALALSANPPEVLLGALHGDPATMPERVLRALLDTWDDPARGEPLRVMLVAAVQDDEMARLLREMLEREIVDRLTALLRGVDARHRAAAFGTQLAGVVFARYLLRLEPVATMPADELVRHLATGLHAVLRSGSTGRPKAARRRV